MFKHILLLEDMKLVCKSVTTILHKHYGDSVCVHGADSYYQADRIADEHSIDVFILDIELGAGQKSGLDFAKRLRESEKYKKAGIIFTTADAAEWKTGINQLHCYGYITKPYKTKELLDSIDSLLEDSQAKRSDADSLTEQEKNMLINIDPKNFHLDESAYRVNLTATGKNALRIKLSDIIYLESRQRKTYIYTIDDKEKYTETKFLPLSKFMNDMKNTYGKDGYFYQCKNCYVINTNYCKYYDHDKQALILAHDDKEFVIYVSRNLQAEAKERFKKIE